MPKIVKQNAMQGSESERAREDAMKKWLHVTAAISLVLFSISVRAQGQARKDIKSESPKVLAAGEVTSKPARATTDDPNYSIAPEDFSPSTCGRSQKSPGQFRCAEMARFHCHC